MAGENLAEFFRVLHRPPVLQRLFFRAIKSLPMLPQFILRCQESLRPTRGKLLESPRRTQLHVAPILEDGAREHHPPTRHVAEGFDICNLPCPPLSSTVEHLVISIQSQLVEGYTPHDDDEIAARHASIALLVEGHRATLGMNRDLKGDGFL